MHPLENPRVSRVPTPACPEKGSRAPILWGAKSCMDTLALPQRSVCTCVCVCRLACGSHGNEIVTSRVAKRKNKLFREAGESTSLENLGLFSPYKEKAGLQDGSYAFQGMIKPHIFSVLEATPRCALVLGPLQFPCSENHL